MAARVYLSLNEKPRVILQVMDRIETEALKAGRSWNAGCVTVIALILLGFLFLGVDVGMDYAGMTPFTLVSFLVWGIAVTLAIYLMVRGRSKIEKGQFEFVRTVLYTLRDDVADKGRVTGWLDLTGPQQKQKIAREGKTSSGRRKVYYQDPWLQFKTKLADGNVLRLSITAMLKEKRGIIVDRRMKMKARLVANPQAYGLRPASAQDFPGLVVAASNGIMDITGMMSPDKPDPWQVLNTLKQAYGYLEPVGQAATPPAAAPTPPPASLPAPSTPG